MAGNKSQNGLLKDGTSRRARTNNRRRVPPVMWLGALVIAAGAFFLFRDPGGGGGGGIGERQSVVTAGMDSMDRPTPEGPRSGSVDISAETRDLVPEEEKSAAKAAAAREETATEPAPPQVKEKKAPAPTPTPVQPRRKPATPAVIPGSSGAWLVQVGSFGDVANADIEAARLREIGWDARVKMVNLADESIAYRVRIGHFRTRDAAQAFAKQESKRIPGAIAVHR